MSKPYIFVTCLLFSNLVVAIPTLDSAVVCDDDKGSGGVTQAMGNLNRRLMGNSENNVEFYVNGPNMGYVKKPIQVSEPVVFVDRTFVERPKTVTAVCVTITSK